VDAVGADNDIGFDFVSVGESNAGAVRVRLDTYAPGSELDSSGRQGSGKDIQQVGSVRSAPSRAESLLEVATLWRLRQDSTAPAITHDLVFGFPRDRSNRGLEVERPQGLHRIRMERNPRADFPQLGRRFVHPGFEAALM